MLRALLVSLLAALVLASPAAASTAIASRKGAGMVRQFTGMGVQFWADRGVTMCADPEAGITPLPEMDAGVEGNGCRFWISSTLVRQAARERWRPHHDGDSLRAQLCATVFHELGHVAGLQHTTSGLMAPVGGPTPYVCQRWVSSRDRRARRSWWDRHLRRGRSQG